MCIRDSLLAMFELDGELSIDDNEARLSSGIDGVTVGGVAPAGRDDAQGRFRRGDAVGFVGDEIVAWGGSGSALAATIERIAEGSELVTIISGDGAPIPLDEIDDHTPDGVELELHEGGQPSWWWLLAGQ